jgi:GMP synthase-like glutamine amidotransferase
VPEKRAITTWLANGVPILGVCLGAQLIAQASGARVGPQRPAPMGWHVVDTDAAAPNDPVLAGLPRAFETVVWHKYAFDLPPGASPLASTPAALQAFRLEERPAWAVQFHPEVSTATLERWLDIAVERGDLSDDDRRRELANSARLAAHQVSLARHICGRFVAQAVGVVR